MSNEQQMKRVDKSTETAEVFPHLVNQAAFVDKVVAEIWGSRRKRSIPRIIGKSNVPIGGPHSFYARCLSRRHALSGNPLQLKYGRMRNYANLSPLKLTMFTLGSPITCADLLMSLDGLLQRGYRVVISSVELTFDTQGIPLGTFGRDLCSCAHVTEVEDASGRTTIYVGGSRSPWQLRIYHKTYFTVRVEFIVRSRFLRALNIRRPQDLLLLKKADLWRHAGFREIDSSQGYALPARIRRPWSERGLTLPPAVPASIVQKELRLVGINPARWVVPSKREALLRNMQDHIVW